MALWNVSQMNWGWHGEDFIGVFQRLSEGAACFANFSVRHETISLAMENHPTYSEEKRASQLFYLIDPDAQKASPKKFKSIGDLKRFYGDQVDASLRALQDVGETVEKLWHLFSPSTYEGVVHDEAVRMDRVVELMTQYETGKLQRRVWAEKMQSKQMRHFFEDEFSEGWYQPIVHDLEHSLYKVIVELEKELWPKFQSYMSDGTAMKIGAVLFFDTVTEENKEKFKTLAFDMYNCTIGEVKTLAHETLKDFKRLYRELQSSYTNLFKKELTEYLENFEFGTKFVSENFAMVNVFLQQMHLERWSQDRTYGFWSLACDVGGALGLFLGASMLTIIELIYLCYQYKICGKIAKKTDRHIRKCWDHGCQHMSYCKSCQSKSLKNSYLSEDLETSLMLNPEEREERQKSSWLGPLSDYSPTYAMRRKADVEDLLDFMDAKENSRAKKYKNDPGEHRSSDEPNLVKLQNGRLQSSREGNNKRDRLADIIEDDSGLESDETGRLKKAPIGSQSMLPEQSNISSPRKPPPQPQEEEENSQMTDSFANATPKLFCDPKDRQTTL
ncbi:hypothetical protein RB195_019288 [Necator americanus]|uniref:Amiloride-sensitive sodium channel n=1 Tax=Necator americanus TaxID=51031 RepID=A0ABR1CDI9_NECAM